LSGKGDVIPYYANFPALPVGKLAHMPVTEWKVEKLETVEVLFTSLLEEQGLL